jgi:L-arabinose transport system substrate-binding protein
VLFALAALTAFVSGCNKPADGKNDGAASGAAPEAGAIKIGFLVKQPESTWFQYEWKFAEQAGRDLGFSVMKIGATDGEKVLAAIDNLAANGAQGFVICTPDTRLGPAIMNKAKAAGLKVIAVDDQFITADGQPMKEVPYLGISASQIGADVGAVLADEMKKRGWAPEDTAVCAVTFDELTTTKERTDNSIRVLTERGFPPERIFRAPQRTTDIPGAFDAMNTLLTKQPGVKHWLICGINDNAVLGAVRALEGRGYAPESSIGIGIDGTDCIDELEKSKPTSFFGSMLLQSRRHGYETAQMMYHWIKDGVPPPLDTRTAGVLITRENFQRVLKEQGLRD